MMHKRKRIIAGYILGRQNEEILTLDSGAPGLLNLVPGKAELNYLKDPQQINGGHW